jgi:hypothetical protein
MGQTTISNFDKALKDLYDDSNVAELTLKRRVLFAMLPKRSDFGGRMMPIVTVTADGGGRAATFTDAQSNITEPGVNAFELKRVNNYALARMTGEAVEATIRDKYAFLGAMEQSVNGAMNALSNSIETQLFRTGTGSIATIGSINPTVGGVALGNDVAVLGEEEDIVNFEVGMVVQVAATDGGTLRTGNTGKVTIDAVDRSNGRITGAVDWAGSGTIVAAAGDFISQVGDGQNNATTAKCISGLSAWLPETATSTAFFGVDRSIDTRLAGQYHNGASQDIDDALLFAASKAARMGGAPTVCVMNHVQYRRLQERKSGQVGMGGMKQYSEVNAQSTKGTIANIGFRAIAVQGDNGVVDVVSSNKCQAELAWMLELDTWCLATLEEPVKFLDTDNQGKYLRVADDDAVETRLVSRGNLYTSSPGYNVRIRLPIV